VADQASAHLRRLGVAPADALQYAEHVLAAKRHLQAAAQLTHEPRPEFWSGAPIPRVLSAAAELALELDRIDYPPVGVSLTRDEPVLALWSASRAEGSSGQ